jgi:hypothetical protein
MNRRTAGVAAIATSLALASTVVLGAGAPAAGADAPPDPPADLRVTDLAPDRLSVAWNPVPGATRYNVTLIPLEPFGSYVRTSTTGLSFAFSPLVWDLLYKVTVRAYVPSAYPFVYSGTTAVTARTLLPEGYLPPSQPTGLRVERDPGGQITQVMWDASTGSAGPLSYQVHLESPEQPWINGVWVRTSENRIDGSAIPFNDGIVAEGETLRLFVTATDRVPKVSPPSESLTMVCCPM